MISKWDGKERRSDPTDHDHIVRLITQNDSIVETLRLTKIELTVHQRKDEEKFEKIMWNQAIGLGIIMTIQFVVVIVYHH